ncbi:uncharacterized protein N0V89_011282 [Didymosphaeria variabile]|uniref:Xylanolytic transcriptional activator regulatory domain-containing protein n=1 Tax=Didymosphaeria variabile TaxID=1932322 RepID=A0A9W8XEX9_9PLEO|nr:uncharacterized protein N0V89_011282 [Didymosphaeria variabile]KAJ4347341.1 hypothetical protein N0V89_011282 [Didymosphaeria variabile]
MTRTQQPAAERDRRDHINRNTPQPRHGLGHLPGVVDLLPSGSFAAELPSGTLTPSGLLGFGFETDLDLSAIDLNFLDTYNTQVPFEYENLVGQIPAQGADTTDQNSGKHGDDGGSNSLSKHLPQSIWRFVPVPGIHAYTDQANLSVPTQEQIVGSPESFADVSRRATSEKLDSPTRDKIFTIVLSQVKSPILPAVSAFPSVELLDKLIQFFLAGPIPTGGSWIHTSSFRPKRARPELLLAIAAAGAVLTPDRSLRKLGFAIEEVVRNHLPVAFESDNTLIRDLEMLQAYMLHLGIGLWSGNSRKMEIAESFQLPLLTMLRRGGRLKRSSYPILTVAADDKDLVLDNKWRAWVEQESFKRLAYRLLSHEAQASMSLLVGPLISYSELELPLPEPQDLWSATSAQEWKILYRAKYENDSTRIPSLAECVANPELLQSNEAVIDLELSCAAFLYALWGMVWEYRKLSLLCYGKKTLWDSNLMLMTRYQELAKIFDYYRLRHATESTLLLESNLMHLHMSLEEVQLFCGLEGQEESRRVHPSIKEWASSKTSRLAVWHAGQLLRATRGLPPMHLRDFYAIILFHASLAFWAYTLASRMLFQDSNSRMAAGSISLVVPPQQAVWLDDEETAATYRYISFNHGMPTLHGSRADMAPIQLDDAPGIMTTMIETMKRGDGEPFRPNSPLVENLLSVMERLRDTKIG